MRQGIFSAWIPVLSKVPLISPLGGSGDSKHLISLVAPSRLPEMPGAPFFTGHGMVAVVELS